MEAINILYAGEHRHWQKYKELLKEKYPNHQINMDLANLDKSWTLEGIDIYEDHWTASEVIEAISKKKYALIILLAENCESTFKNEFALLKFNETMDLACRLIPELTIHSKAIILSYVIKRRGKKYIKWWIDAGAVQVNCQPYYLRRIVDDIGAILGFEDRLIEKFIYQKPLSSWDAFTLFVRRLFNKKLRRMSPGTSKCTTRGHFGVYHPLRGFFGKICSSSYFQMLCMINK